MALGFNVAGPCRLQFILEGGTLVDLGETTDDDMIRVEFERHMSVLKSTSTGDEPAEIVHTGMTAIITGTLVQWDPDVTNNTKAFHKVATAPGGTTEGDAGVIGTRYVTGSLTGSLAIIPRTVGKTSYTFGRCIITRWQLFDFGNVEVKLGFEAMAWRDAATGSIGDGTSATANLYATATTA